MHDGLWAQPELHRLTDVARLIELPAIVAGASVPLAASDAVTIA